MRLLLVVKDAPDGSREVALLDDNAKGMVDGEVVQLEPHEQLLLVACANKLDPRSPERALATLAAIMGKVANTGRLVAEDAAA